MNITKQSKPTKHHLAVAAPQPCCRQKAAGWRAFHDFNKVLKVL
jgi:hypothetical protein